VSRTRIEVTGLDKWIDGFGRLGEPHEPGVVRWRQATEVMFDRSQQAVHVITAALKASGRYDAHKTVGEIVGEVTYGGTADCDYAVYEFRRGGSHDALRRGFVEARQTFVDTLNEIVEEEVSSWR